MGTENLTEEKLSGRVPVGLARNWTGILVHVVAASLLSLFFAAFWWPTRSACIC